MKKEYTMLDVYNALERDNVFGFRKAIEANPSVAVVTKISPTIPYAEDFDFHGVKLNIPKLSDLDKIGFSSLSLPYKHCKLILGNGNIETIYQTNYVIRLSKIEGNILTYAIVRNKYDCSGVSGTIAL